MHIRSAKPERLNNLDRQLAAAEFQEKKLFLRCAGMRKHQKSANWLKLIHKENYDVLTDLYVGTGRPKTKSISDLQETQNIRRRPRRAEIKIIETKKALKEIDEQIFIAKKELDLMKAKVCNETQYQITIEESRMAYEKLQNKLETVIKSCCKINDENRMLREEIDHYLQERENDNSDLSNTAVLAYNERDVAVAMLNVLREKSCSNFHQQVEEMEQLQRQKDQKLQLMWFLRYKNQKRIMQNLSRIKLQKAKNRHEALVGKTTTAQENLQLILNLFEADTAETFSKIYDQLEFANFSACNLVISIKSEMTTLTDKILKLVGKIRDDSKVSRYNVFRFLSEIEHTIDTLLLTGYQIQRLREKETESTIKVIDDSLIPHRIISVIKSIKTTPCPLCEEKEQVTDVVDEAQHVCSRTEIERRVKLLRRLPNAREKLHSVSSCHMSQSRETIQRKYM
ncbi:hypothetical protein FQR65_LT07289 [Abscondita terminalis]|nr:hypothetical protein FQR65_LT07289 [Abscondita terminalis]